MAKYLNQLKLKYWLGALITWIRQDQETGWAAIEQNLCETLVGIVQLGIGKINRKWK